MRYHLLSGVVGLVLVLLNGCGPAVINAEDVVVAPGQPARFVVSIDRMYTKPSVPGAEVSFTVAGRPVGQTRTDANGVATLTSRIPSGASEYRVRAGMGGECAQGDGRIFQWDPGRTIVAVDVDDTISRTDYGSLFLTDLDTTSPAFDHSPEAVREMARTMNVLYVSARPRWLHNKTKVWLDSKGFPPGPVLHADKFDACMHQGHYKDRMLAEFQSQFPSLLIGIGDKSADDFCYGRNRMLAVIIDKRGTTYRDHCIVLPTWEAVEGFFATNSDRLSDAYQLASTIQANNMNLRRLFATGEPEQAGAQAKRNGRPPAVASRERILGSVLAAPRAASPAAVPPIRTPPRPTGQAEQFIAEN